VLLQLLSSSAPQPKTSGPDAVCSYMPDLSCHR
jgi:hypothetical protein